MFTRFSLFGMLIGCSGLLGCAGELGPAEPGELGVKISLLAPPGCEPLPAGTLPPSVTLVELSLRDAVEGGEVQAASLLVDPAARCQDSQGREFACPFDVDQDGLRERYFSFGSCQHGAALFLAVILKDAESNVRWSGQSEPVLCEGGRTTPIPVELSPASETCQ